MAYTKVHEEWENYPDSSTPVDAAAMEHIEQGIADAADDADAANSALSNLGISDVSGLQAELTRIENLIDGG